MNRDDIIRMAREAECSETWGMDAFQFTVEELERFFHAAYAAGAAAEREECAKVCDSVGDAEGHVYDAADAIRARGNT